MSFRLAAAEMTLPGETLEEKFTFVRKVGFDGIELSARGDGIFGARIDELRRARDAGVLMPTAVVHMDHFIGDFDAGLRRDAIEQLKIHLSTIAAAGGTGIVSPHAFGLFSRRLPPFTPPRSVEDSRAALVEALRELGEHAESVGTKVYLEPLNRFEDFVINQLADAASVIEEVGSPGVMITADTFHMSIEEARIGESIRKAGPMIGHVQLGDSNRLEPGAGHYDWPETLEALHAIGYDGWLAMECGLSGPVDQILPEVADLLST
ncbi:sugar phosphate isomerase/epimerase family protein [Kribbella pratensis]|uniref:Sugar phosphate isomerase/epimerase n=1 Tax=Kribbella pratensis TaxID=2512112 RepID=A0A4R8C0T5_9ACTN|nr:sugar phosphate isomerase/epimerase family protein [Kribbella pratensis]TDW69318.1 sugar phosphate isomerase/epimerase [Kribbella pratensis]